MPELIDAAPGTPEWLAARRQGITATDLPAILGISPYDSAYSLYYRKRGELPELEDNDRFRLGRDLEPIIAARWCDSQHVPAAHRVGARSALYRSTERPWQMATLDRLFYDEPVELKSWADADRHTWNDQPPPTVRAQLLWQMDTMGVSRGHVGVLFLPSGEFRSFTIEHEDGQRLADVIDGEYTCPVCTDQALMRSAGRDFMDSLDLGQPPSLDGSVATLAAVRARLIPAPGKTAAVDAGALAGLKSFRDQIKELEKAARLEESIIRESAGDATVYTDALGEVIGRRVIVNAPVKAHTRHQDYIRITQKGTNDE